MNIIKVLIVDDSALIRSLLTEIINQESDMRVVGAAPDAFVAKDMVNKFGPDVITLDIEMPKVDGLTFLDRLIKARPTPVIMISTLTENGAEATLKALELGAIDFIAKPKLGVAEGIKEYQSLIIDKIRAASKSKVRVRRSHTSPIPAQITVKGSEGLIAIGASTGGTEAIKQVLVEMPANSPAIVITQHMPPGFTSTFARRLDSLCAVKVREAKDGERVLPGNAYVAPGNLHMQIVKSGADLRIQLNDGEKVMGHKPSVDVMFESVAVAAGGNSVGVILTGMGKDGAKGMALLNQQGAHTLAQDEASCVVFGMPKEAIKTSKIDEVLDLKDISSAIVGYLNKNPFSHRQ